MRLRSSHQGTDEQVFGAKQQDPYGPEATTLGLGGPGPEFQNLKLKVVPAPTDQWSHCCHTQQGRSRASEVPDRRAFVMFWHAPPAVWGHTGDTDCPSSPPQVPGLAGFKQVVHSHSGNKVTDV
jgi:hypothetical protein